MSPARCTTGAFARASRKRSGSSWRNVAGLIGRTRWRITHGNSGAGTSNESPVGSAGGARVRICRGRQSVRNWSPKSNTIICKEAGFVIPRTFEDGEQTRSPRIAPTNNSRLFRRMNSRKFLGKGERDGPRFIPLLVRRGGCAIKKNDPVPNRRRRGWSLTRNVARERPPPSAPTKVASGHLIDVASTPLTEEGNNAHA